MKILLVSEDIPATKLGGLGKHVVTLGNALLGEGHEVVLMGRARPDYADCAEEVGFQGRFIVGFSDPFRGWKERDLGFFNPWKRSFFARRIAEGIERHAGDFDVVHYHGHHPMVALFVAATTRFVQTRHDQGSECITHVRFKNGEMCTERSPVACAGCIHADPGLVRRGFSAWAVSRYRSQTEAAFARHPVVFVSEFLRRNYHAALPTARLGNTHVVHNFVDERLLGSAGPLIRGDSPIVIHVAGRLDASKGITAFLERLVPELPAGWRVNVFGDGPDRDVIASRIAGADVVLQGHRLYAETIAATRDADVVVVPSVCEESCGTVIMEALRLGKPCFALARGGTPELARYGAEGQLRLFNSLAELVAALLAGAESFVASVGGESADVRARLPQLLAIYQNRPEVVG